MTLKLAHRGQLLKGRHKTKKIFLMLNICAVFKTSFLCIKTEDFVVNVNVSGILICHTFSMAPSVNYDDLRNALFH